MMEYWQKRNIDLFTIEKQTKFTMEQLLKMSINDYYNLLATIIGYNRKVKAEMQTKKPKPVE